MIVGQPGSGQAVLARAMGEALHLPVVDLGHRGERAPAEVLEGARWIIAGGDPAGWTARLARADALVWLDLPVLPRLLRLARSGQSVETLRAALSGRLAGRTLCAGLHAQAGSRHKVFHLRSDRAARGFVHALRYAVRQGTLETPEV